MVSPISNRCQNRLLQSIPPEELHRFDAYLEPVQLSSLAVLVEPEASIEYVHFIEEGMAEVTTATVDGRFLDVYQIGPEGMAGVCVVFGTADTHLRTAVQLSGSAYRLRSDCLVEAMKVSPSLRSTVLRYAHVCLIQVADAATSIGRFSVTERLTRWISMAHDRCDADALVITHDRLAGLLDVRRAEVTDAIAVLEGDGMIRGCRSHIQVRDRQKLKTKAGMSYGRAEVFYERAVGQLQAAGQ